MQTESCPVDASAAIASAHRLKILQVAPAYYPAISIGGPIQSSLTLATLLHKQHDVTVLTTPLGLSAEETRSIAYDVEAKAPFGGKLIYKRFYGYPHFTFSPSTYTWLRSHIDEYDLVVIHGVWNFPNLSAAAACQAKRIPYLIYPHGTLYPETVMMRSAIKKQLFLRLCVKRMLKKAAGVVFTTEDEVAKVSQYVGVPLRSWVIPHLVKDDGADMLPPRGRFRRQLGIGDSTWILLHLGRIAPKKNLSITIEVLQRLRAGGKKVELVVAGSDYEGERSRLDSRLEESGLRGAVHYTGLLSREAISELLADADVFMLPSLSENFGVAVVEAMLAKVPVVISDAVGISPDIAARDAGVVVPLSDGVGGFATAVAALLDDPAERNRLADAGRGFAIEAYGEASIAQRVADLVASVTR